ncbi:MAG: ParB/RepB/Spo0J family partition protein [Candidatus Kapaibacterium sp.]|nr:MAG: ParB/RepB/Spo0J family partition protein [Candidatus Kapabacteria bacterium]
MPTSFSIDPLQDSPKADDGKSVGVIAMIEVPRVRPNPMQPRQDFDREALDDLKKSIKEKGVIQPITVRRSEDGYEIIAGERRVRASTELGMETIPAYILDIETDAEMLELALIENVQRENLNPIEVALGYRRLMEECSLTQEEVAKKVGKDRTTITNFMRLLRLPKDIQQSLRKRTLSMGHARAILAITDETKQHEVFEYVKGGDVSVRKTEELVKKIEAGFSITEALAVEIPANKPPSASASGSASGNGNGNGAYSPAAMDVPVSMPPPAPHPTLPTPAISTEGFEIPNDMHNEFHPPYAPETNQTNNEAAHQAQTDTAVLPTERDPNIIALETKFRHILATQVRIKARPNGSGSIEIDFYSVDELERIQELLEIIEREQYS